MVNHRKTAKAMAALQMMYEISGENPHWILRSDHQTVYAAYQQLEDMGYEWVTEKQEWAYIERGPAHEPRRIVLYAPVTDLEQALKLVEDGALLNDITLGEITRIDIITETGQQGAMLYIELKS